MKLLQRVLGIEPEEGRSLFPLLLQAVLANMGLCMLEVSSTSLFLSEYGPSALPWAFIAIGVVVSTFTFGITRILGRLSVTQLVVGVFLTTIVALLVGWGALINEITWFSFVLVITTILFIQLHLVCLGNLAGRIYDLRQMKRIFPLIITGAVSGWMIGGVTIPALTGLVGRSANLLLVGVVLQAAGLWATSVTLRRYRDRFGKPDAPPPPPPSQGQPKPKAKPERDPTTKRFVRSLFTYQMLSAIGTQMLLYIFLAKAQERYPVPEDLSRFFGWVQGGMNFLSIIALVGLAAYLFQRYGLKLGLTANPLLVLAFLVAMLVQGGLFGVAAVGFFFALATGGRIVDMVATNAMTGTALKTSYQVLPADQRGVVEMTVEGVGVPVAYGLTGIVLLVVGAIPGVTMMHIVGLTLLFTFAWTAASRLIIRDYPEMLRAALMQRDLRGGTLSLDDPETITGISQGLASDDPTVVVFSLDLLDQARPEALGERLATLLDHPRAEVRSEVARRIERGVDDDGRRDELLERLAELAESDPDPSVRGACMRAVTAAGGAQVIDRILPHLNDSEPEARMGAMVALLRSGGIRGTLMAGAELLQDAGSEEPERRLFVARVLREIGSSDFYDPLLDLLEDEDLDVRREALRSAGELAHPRLWPLVIAALGRGAERGTAVGALVRGEAPAELLIDEFQRDDAEKNVRLSSLRVLGRLPDLGAVAFLERQSGNDDDQLRGQAIESLSLASYQAPEESRQRMLDRYQAEVASAVRTAAVLEQLGEGAGTELLRSALDQTLERIRQRTFLILSFLYDPQTVLRARDGLESEDGGQRAYAFEALDVLLPQEVKKTVLPLFESATAADLVAALEPLLPENLRPGPIDLRDLPSDEAFTPWTRACALWSQAHDEQANRNAALGQCSTALASPHSVLRETAIAALGHLDPNAAGERAADLHDDPNPRVRRQLQRLEEEDTLTTLEIVLFLKSIELFSRIPDEDLVWISEMTEEVRFGAGETFIAEGDAGDCLYVIVAGEASAEVEGVGQVNTMGPREVVGEMAILSNIPRTASCIATSPVTALRIDRSHFLELLRDRSEIAISVIRVLVERLDRISRAR
ncbi:MAG: cyclic nucleotide-binding domain-containing protein [bacterium]|nr:cyclic nucleotide-binding domain-containing protein [bacterium]